MIALRPGERLIPGQTVSGDGCVLTYQGDGNLVVYRKGVPIWDTHTFTSPGYAEMQGDGNFVLYDINAVPYWATGTNTPGGLLELTRERLAVVVPTAVWTSGEFPPPAPGPGPDPGPEPGPVPPGFQIVGRVGVHGVSFGDATGPRLLHGCTDLGAVKKWREDPDKMRRQLDVVARHQKYVRFATRLNGDPWTTGGLNFDPLTDGWWDEALHGYGVALWERGIRANPTLCDMYNISDAQAENIVRRTGQIFASISPDLVWLYAVINEMRGTWPGGESDANIAKMARHLEIFHAEYPGALLAGSDPENQAKSGMERLAPAPANVALIHDVRQGVADACRRVFNTPYDNRPYRDGVALAIVQDEHTGPNGSVPYPHGQRVYQPTNDPHALLAIYSLHIFTGQASTYFNDPALISREPLESTWGFMELPAAWAAMGVPQNIGQGRLLHGQRAESPLHIKDGVVTVNVDCDATLYNADGALWEGRLSAGQRLPVIPQGQAARADCTVIDGAAFGAVSGNLSPVTLRLIL